MCIAIIYNSFVEQVIKEVENKLEENRKQQEKITQEMALLPKGHINILYRNGKGYYYLTYREKDKIKNKYLGPVGKSDLTETMEKLTQREKTVKELKHLKVQEKEYIKLLGKNKKNATKTEI